MKIKTIRFPHDWEDIEDIENANIDVFVDVEDVEDSYTYNVTVGTAKNLEALMDKENMNYSELGYPFIIVKKLTPEIIEETLQAYAEYDDGYWLKLYYFAQDIDTTVFNKLEAEDISNELNNS